MKEKAQKGRERKEGRGGMRGEGREREWMGPPCVSLNLPTAQDMKIDTRSDNAISLSLTFSSSSSVQ